MGQCICMGRVKEGGMEQREKEKKQNRGSYGRGKRKLEQEVADELWEKTRGLKVRSNMK